MQFFEWLSTAFTVVVGWCVACFLMSFTSGWQHLAEHFRATQNIAQSSESQAFYMQQGRLNGNPYRNCLTIKTTNQGLYLSVMLPFRPTHAPLLIPWSALSDFKTDKNIWLIYHITTITSPSGRKVELGLINETLVNVIESYRAADNI